MPTIKTSEFAVLQIVGLDAAVVSGKSGFCGAVLEPFDAAVEFPENVVLLILYHVNSRRAGTHASQLQGARECRFSLLLTYSF
jgi:hypothetical protein